MSEPTIEELNKLVTCDGYGSRFTTGLAAIILGANPDGQIYESPLIWACEEGNTIVARALIRLGASVKVKNRYGDSLLSIAIESKSKDSSLVKLLIENGAELSEINTNVGGALHLAVHVNNVAAITILLENGADPSRTNPQGRTAAQMAHSLGNHAAAIAIERFAQLHQNKNMI